MSAQYASFSAGGRRWAIDLLQIREILKPLPLSPMPLSGQAIRGLANLRGQIVTVVDFAQALGLPPEASPRHVLILRTDAQLAQLKVRGRTLESVGSDAIGLLVEGIGEVLEADEARLTTPSREDATFGVHSVLQNEEELVLLPSLAQLMGRLDGAAAQA